MLQAMTVTDCYVDGIATRLHSKHEADIACDVPSCNRQKVFDSCDMTDDTLLT